MMFDSIIIREEKPQDHRGAFDVNTAAFESDAEARLVDALRESGFVRLSLVAELDGVIVGNVLFSRLPIVTATGVVEALALAPMAVHPQFQRRGIGTRLVENGLQLCHGAGHRIVLVLGHPQFYPRFGFSAHLAAPLSSPFGDGEAWMGLELVSGALTDVVGRVEYAAPFMSL